ncbi:MAG: M23 family metallopeptidase [Gammaproteobacteria bacterium]|nr:M23 family metallopeptidase [Gammaproteobacteria bacterium]MDE0251336.1 M23 family metallopeptidase [Gammaproteobacteria bacterium]MDE0401980.1 M23 family metallopeptidase [Gammaproteobacteria bacterium]
MCARDRYLISLSLLVLLVLGLCGCTSVKKASVEEREVVLLRPDEDALNYGYVVNSGDTLYAISRLMGLTVKEVAEMNGLEPPYVIYPGQRLFVIRGSWMESDTTMTELEDLEIAQPTDTTQPPRTRESTSVDSNDQTVPASTPDPVTQQPTEPKAQQPIAQQSEGIPDANTPATLDSSSVAPTDSTATNITDSQAGFVARTEPRITFAETQKIQEQAKALPKGWEWPVDVSPTNEWNADSEDGGLTYLLGANTSVKAAASGRVTYAGISVSEYKYMILIKTPDDYVVQYDFNTALELEENDLVSKGDPVFFVGDAQGETDSNTQTDRYRTIKFAIWKRGVAQNPASLIDE